MSWEAEREAWQIEQLRLEAPRRAARLAQARQQLAGWDPGPQAPLAIGPRPVVELAPLRPLPPVVMSATECSGTEPWMPRSPKAILNAARKAGWQARLTRAVGPRINAAGVVPDGAERTYTLAVAAAKDSRRLVWIWRWNTDKWVPDGALDNERGAVGHTQAKEAL